MPKQSAKEQVQVNFRMPVELRDLLSSHAEDSRRSLNAEIVRRLEQSFEDKFLENEFIELTLLSEIRVLRQEIAELSNRLAK